MLPTYTVKVRKRITRGEELINNTHALEISRADREGGELILNRRTVPAQVTYLPLHLSCVSVAREEICAGLLHNLATEVKDESHCYPQQHDVDSIHSRKPD